MAHNEAALDKVMADMEIDGLLDWWRMVRDRLREVATLMDDACMQAGRGSLRTQTGCLSGAEIVTRLPFPA